jgi:hypothetical protein
MLYKVARGALVDVVFERRVCDNESAFAVTKNFGLITNKLA